jgi:hypothetical protein
MEEKRLDNYQAILYFVAEINAFRLAGLSGKTS